jgi:hypothetical protein
MINYLTLTTSIVGGTVAPQRLSATVVNVRCPAACQTGGWARAPGGPASCRGGRSRQTCVGPATGSRKFPELSGSAAGGQQATVWAER